MSATGGAAASRADTAVRVIGGLAVRRGRGVHEPSNRVPLDGYRPAPVSDRRRFDCLRKSLSDDRTIYRPVRRLTNSLERQSMKVGLVHREVPTSDEAGPWVASRRPRGERSCGEVRADGTPAMSVAVRVAAMLRIPGASALAGLNCVAAAAALTVLASPAAAQSTATCTLNLVCEAETGILHDGAGIEDEHAGYTGTGFVDQLFGAAGVKLTVNATEAISHRVTVRYANANPGTGVASRRFTLTVNGTSDIPVLFPTTENWATWSTVTMLVPLRPGSTSSTSAPARTTTARSTSTTSSSRRPPRSPRTA